MPLALPVPISKAYVYTEIENRPPINFDIPVPPLHTVYPKSIQNNVESRVVNRPELQRQYSAPSIPLSLPSIVHEPSNTVATIQNVPSTFANALSDAQRISSSPVITSTYSNRESFSNGHAREKVVVKVVKAPGWYLNDAEERNSYFNAVAHGLLSENGLVYVNNVQKENGAHLIQNVPINFNPSNVAAPAFIQTQTSPSQSLSAAYSSSKDILPPAILQSQSGHSSASVPQLNLNYWSPCVQAAYSQLTQALPQVQSQSHHYRIHKRSADQADPYTGRSSYNVDSKSIGRLAGDGQLYSFASLRQPERRVQQ